MSTLTLLQSLNYAFQSKKCCSWTKGTACCRRRVEQVQDLEFPEACQDHLRRQLPVRRGHPPPRLRCYELSELSMKFERHFDSEVVDFQVRVVVFSCWQA